MGQTIRDLGAASDDELVRLWRVAADDAANHESRRHSQGHCPGADWCEKRKAALAEADAYAEQITERRRVRGA